MQDYTAEFLPCKEKAIYKNKNKYIPLTTSRDSPRITLVARSGSGKTNFVLYLCKNMSLDKVYICCKQTDEPVYVGLAEKLNRFSDTLGYEICEIHTLDTMPKCAELDSDLLKLVVFDDLVFESKRSSLMNDYMIASRKKKCCVVNLVHNWTETGKRIRENTNCFGIFHQMTNADLRNIYRDATPNCSFDEFCRCYRISTAQGRGHFLFVDKTVNSKQRKLPELRHDMIIPLKYKAT